MDKLVSQNYDLMCHYILECNKQIENFTSGIAKHVHYVYSVDLHKLKYNDIYEFCNSLGISRKTCNYYLNVVERFFEYDIKEFKTSVYKQTYYKIKDNVKGFNYSQLKACLGLSDNEIIQLEIDNKTTVKEIEKRKKELKKTLNALAFVDCSGVPPDQSTNEQQYFVSYNDTINNINPFELGFIPEGSEYLYIFDGDNTMIKGVKSKRNVNTAIKHLRMDIEKNLENNICYAVVKIKKEI